MKYERVVSGITNCKSGKHDFAVIHSSGDEMEECVIRWCRFCGSIVMDLDSDGRMMRPGHYMKLKSPQYIGYSQLKEKGHRDYDT